MLCANNTKNRVAKNNLPRLCFSAYYEAVNVSPQERGKRGAASRWANATKADREANGSWLNKDLTAQQLSDRARAAVNARWKKHREAKTA